MSEQSNVFKYAVLYGIDPANADMFEKALLEDSDL
jgi:hypothetical protein